MTLFMEITRDEYELPLKVASNVPELARMCNLKEQYIWCYLTNV